MYFRYKIDNIKTKIPWIFSSEIQETKICNDYKVLYNNQSRKLISMDKYVINFVIQVIIYHNN